MPLSKETSLILISKLILETMLFYLPTTCELENFLLNSVSFRNFTVCRHKRLDEKLCIYTKGSFNKFPDFFCMATFIDSTHMKL